MTCEKNPQRNSLNKERTENNHQNESQSYHMDIKKNENLSKSETLQWVCVYCEKAVFPTYQEACEHEAICPEATNRRTFS